MRATRSRESKPPSVAKTTRVRGSNQIVLRHRPVEDMKMIVRLSKLDRGPVPTGWAPSTPGNSPQDFEFRLQR